MKHSVLGISAAIVALLLTSCTPNKGSFSLINNANEPIARASVTICSQTIEFKGIQPNKSAAGSYEVRSDSHYEIRIEFQSGKKLQKETGYVTNGMDFQHEISVTNSDIAITDSKAK